MTVKNEPIHTISYELHPYMPLSILYLDFLLLLLLLHCSLSIRFTRFPISAIVNIIFVWSLFFYSFTHKD